MWLRTILFILFCATAGSAISAGYVAFITLLGIFEKLAEKIKAYKYGYIIETLIILGVTLGNILFLFQVNLPFGNFGYIFFTLMGGIFTGCLAGALAETLKVFPILSRRFGVRKGLPYILIAGAIGKAIGCAINLLFLV